MVRRSLLIGLVAVGMSVSACSGAVAGSPSAPSAGSKPGLPYAGAPKVAHPVDTAKYHANPCAAISPRAIKKLGLQQTPRSDPAGKPGPSCTYPGGADGINVDWALIKGNDGLSTPYSKKNNYARFRQQKDVNGFPALIALAKPDPGPSTCVYLVGTSDDEVVYISVNEPNYKQNHVDVCNDTKQVALSLTNTIVSGR
jgi:hypothetical protein